VAGVEQAPEVLIVVGLLAGPPQGVGLVHQQGWRVFADGADDRGDGGVDGDQWLVAGLGDDVDQAALAAALEG